MQTRPYRVSDSRTLYHADMISRRVLAAAVLMVAGTFPMATPARAQQQDEHTQDVAQLQALQQQLIAGADPCVVIPKLKALLLKMSSESAENAAALKPSLDLLKQGDTGCPAAPSPPPAPAAPPAGTAAK